jgi:hypothetical protein
MKLVTKVLAVLSVLALSTPALACACGDKTNTKSAEAKASSSKTVAKAGEKKAVAPAKRTQQAKPAATANGS